ncbi:unnamed protein product [Sphagnum balticum]
MMAGGVHRAAAPAGVVIAGVQQLVALVITTSVLLVGAAVLVAASNVNPSIAADKDVAVMMSSAAAPVHQQQPLISINCSDPSEEQKPECTSPSIDCWQNYISNSSMMNLCKSFTSAAAAPPINNSSSSSSSTGPTAGCCSAVRMAWQLWPPRCFCNYIYFQYVQEINRRALPALCLNVTNSSVCHTCSIADPSVVPLATCSSPNPTGKSSTKRVALAIALTITAITVCIIVVVLVYCLPFRYKKKASLRFPDTSQDLDDILKFGGGPTIFSYSVLKTATKNFHIGNKLGEGGFGAVYKGLLPDGTEVAVKQLSVGSKQGNEEFLNEVMFITGVQHRNLVKLRGCCLKDDERLLVYEYLPNKSLYQALFDEEHAVQIDWPTRLRIVLGTARGLAYLHEGCRTRIVHRDIKASNILLDEDYNPKIADFGLARFFLDNQTHVSTRVAGTKGYLAPEYVVRGQLTEKADVFSFGVVVLELVSGRSNFDHRLPTDTPYLLDWSWQLHEKKRLKDIMDPSLLEGPGYSEEEALRVVTIALLCTQSEPTMRPTMTRVVAMLVGDSNTEIPPILKSSKLRPLVLTELPNMSTWNDISNAIKGNNSQLSNDQVSRASMRSGSVSDTTMEPR